MDGDASKKKYDFFVRLAQRTHDLVVRKKNMIRSYRKGLEEEQIRQIQKDLISKDNG